MKGAVERWVPRPESVPAYQGSTEICVWMFRTQRDFLAWAQNSNRDWSEHPTCEAVAQAYFTGTQSPCKLYRLTRLEYVGYLLPIKV